MTYSGERDENTRKSVIEITKRWGGSFVINYEKNWKKVINNWMGKKILLTMYGINLPECIEKIRQWKDLLVIIGSEKVPPSVYDMIDYQVAVTNQPHSEVAALAIFLDRYQQGKEMNKKFPNAKIIITPKEKGKKVNQS